MGKQNECYQVNMGPIIPNDNSEKYYMRANYHIYDPNYYVISNNDVFFEDKEKAIEFAKSYVMNDTTNDNIHAAVVYISDWFAYEDGDLSFYKEDYIYSIARMNKEIKENIIDTSNIWTREERLLLEKNMEDYFFDIEEP